MLRLASFQYSKGESRLAMPTDFAPSMSAPDMLSSPELGLDGINVKHNALVNKVSHVEEDGCTRVS